MLPNYCLNIKNVVFIIILNEKVIKPIVEDYFKIPKENDEHYQLFLEKITSNPIDINDFPVNYQFHNLEILKDNKILQCSKDETNKYIKNKIKNKIKIRNQRHILKKINNKASWQKISIFEYLLKKEKSEKITSIDAALFEIIQYFTIFSILLKKIPNKINDLTLSDVFITNNYHYCDYSTTYIHIIPFFKNKHNIQEFLKKNVENYRNLPYSNFFTFKNEQIEEMNFLDFYFIKNATKPSFNLYYIDMKNENNYLQEIEILNNIYQQENLVRKVNILILHYDKKEEIKIIFDLSKITNLLNFKNDEDIWIKLSEIKTSNKILDYYDETIHNYIINLLTNDDWENNYQNLKAYLSKKENDLIQIETTIQKEIENVS